MSALRCVFLVLLSFHVWPLLAWCTYWIPTLAWRTSQSGYHCWFDPNHTLWYAVMCCVFIAIFIKLLFFYMHLCVFLLSWFFDNITTVDMQTISWWFPFPWPIGQIFIQNGVIVMMFLCAPVWSCTYANVLCKNFFSTEKKGNRCKGSLNFLLVEINDINFNFFFILTSCAVPEETNIFQLPLCAPLAFIPISDREERVGQDFGIFLITYGKGVDSWWCDLYDMRSRKMHHKCLCWRIRFEKDIKAIKSPLNRII